MVVIKRKKVGKYRSHTTHGGGHRKKRRGAGSRGGRGRAGSGKRAGHKRFLYGNLKGKKGFTSKRVGSRKALNVGHFTSKYLDKLISAGKAVKEGDLFSLDLSKIGYYKLLATGNTSLKLKITVGLCTPRAAEKIKSAGGEIVSLGSNSRKKSKSSEQSVDNSKNLEKLENSEKSNKAVKKEPVKKEE